MVIVFGVDGYPPPKILPVLKISGLANSPAIGIGMSRGQEDGRHKARWPPVASMAARGGVRVLDVIPRGESGVCGANVVSGG